jgi:hypothetical protein
LIIGRKGTLFIGIGEIGRCSFLPQTSRDEFGSGSKGALNSAIQSPFKGLELSATVLQPVFQYFIIFGVLFFKKHPTYP